MNERNERTNVSPVLLLERSGGVATLTLNRPAVKNAIDKAMLRAMTERLAEIDADTDVRVLVITGAGGEFCSGAQLEAIDRAGDDRALHPYLMMDRGQPIGLALHRVRVPTIARVDGLAIGMGMPPSRTPVPTTGRSPATTTWSRLSSRRTRSPAPTSGSARGLRPAALRWAARASRTTGCAGSSTSRAPVPA